MIRQTLSFAVILVFVSCLTGCIYIPMPERPVGKAADPLKLVGPADSKKPIRPAVATREQVVKNFPVPWWKSKDGHLVYYLLETQTGAFIWPLFFYGEPQLRHTAVRFEFDDNGVLREYDIEKGKRSDWKWARFPPRPERIVVPRTHPSDSPAATTPATAPVTPATAESPRRE